MEKFFCLQYFTSTIYPNLVPLSDILCYLVQVHLQKSGLTFSSLKVHLAVISLYHDLIDMSILLFHRFTKIFMKDMLQLHPPCKAFVSDWKYVCQTYGQMSSAHGNFLFIPHLVGNCLFYYFGKMPKLFCVPSE